MSQTQAEEIEPSLLLGSNFRCSKAFWFGGLTSSASVVAAFKAAFRLETPNAGLTDAQVKAEEALFDDPTVWRDCIIMRPTTVLLSDAMRFGVSSLSAAELQPIVDTARKLNDAVAAQLVDGSIVAEALAAVPGPVTEEKADIMNFVLLAPARSDAFLYSTTSNRCITVNAMLNLDVDALSKALRRVIPKPTPQQLCTSRSVCFGAARRLWLAASKSCCCAPAASAWPTAASTVAHSTSCVAMIASAGEHRRCSCPTGKQCMVAWTSASRGRLQRCRSLALSTCTSPRRPLRAWRWSASLRSGMSCRKVPESCCQWDGVSSSNSRLSSV